MDLSKGERHTSPAQQADSPGSSPRSLSSSEIEVKRTLPRKMKFTEFESEVTKSGNSGHVIVPKDWIGKKVKVSIIDEE